MGFQLLPLVNNINTHSEDFKGLLILTTQFMNKREIIDVIICIGAIVGFNVWMYYYRALFTCNDCYVPWGFKIGLGIFAILAVYIWVIQTEKEHQEYLNKEI